MCDAIGGTGPFFPNAYWLVVCSQHGRYFFHNNYNYLAMKNGKVVIIPSTNNEKPPNEAEFRVQDVLGSAQAIYMESVQMPGHFVTFDDDGVPGDETKAKTKDKFAQLEIQLVRLFFVIALRGRRCEMIFLWCLDCLWTGNPTWKGWQYDRNIEWSCAAPLLGSDGCCRRHVTNIESSSFHWR